MTNVWRFRRNIWTIPMVVTAEEGRKRGLTYAQIADQLGGRCSPNAVRRALARLA